MPSLIELIPPLRPAFEQPQPVLERAPQIAVLARGETKAIGEMLAALIIDESSLYAITREWRYDAAGRKFLRLHALLDEQFSEIGTRLTTLAARSRELGAWKSTGHGDRARPPRAMVAGGSLQVYMLRELLGLHEALIASLGRASLLASDHFHDSETTDLLAGLTANHEKDAFMLRALLWEVQNTAA